MPQACTAVVLSCLLIPGVAIAQPATAPSAEPREAPSKSISLTIYSANSGVGFDPQDYLQYTDGGEDVPGFAVVRDIRQFDLHAGENLIEAVDVAAFIDPTSVFLSPLPAAGEDAEQPASFKVLDQSFRYDLVSPDRLLQTFLDREISVHVTRGDQSEKITGKLLSVTKDARYDGLVLQTAEGVRVVPYNADVELGTLPEGLVTRPTLRWRLQAEQDGVVPVRTTYQTGGIAWRADYNLLLGADETTADLAAWVTLLNMSGAKFENAQLKLLAGDINRLVNRGGSGGGGLFDDDEEEDFESEAFFEYYLYTLGRPVTVERRSTQQITLFPTANDISVEKQLIYGGHLSGFSGSVETDSRLVAQGNPKVDVYINIENRKDTGLGMPLPAGKVRVLKADPNDGIAEFIGEDLIDHTPEGNTVTLKVGQSFDVTGSRTQTRFSAQLSEKWIIESFEITLKNAKAEPQDVSIREPLFRWSNWEITEHSDEFNKLDSRVIEFPVTVPPKGEKTVTYTVRYEW